MAERSIELDSIELAAAIFGNCDQNIHLLEKEFHVTAVCRGSVLRFTGAEADVDAAAHAVDGMVTLMENHTPLEEQTVRYCISLARGGEEKRLRELTDDFVAVTAKGRPIHPKTLGQKEYLAAIRSHAITFGVGPAGTGKTYLAVAMAVKSFKSKDVSRIILTRPAVEAGENLGFLPGSDKSRVTRAETTLAALRAAVTLLGAPGLLSVHAYTGHQGGAEECRQVLDFFATLPRKLWRVHILGDGNKPRNGEWLVLAERIQQHLPSSPQKAPSV